MSTSNDAQFDLFISYAHADNGNGWLTALVEAIRAEHGRFTSTPLKIFFDQTDIVSMSDWEHRILRGLRDSKIMLAALSPAYFQSEYCRKEWEIYLEHELSQAMPGEAIAPIYIATYADFEEHADEALNEWMRNLKRRQYLDVRKWWLEGPLALAREDVRHRLELLDQQIGERLERLGRVQASPTTIPDHNPNFVGRMDELRRLREALALGRVGAIVALHGIGGIGKSALAFEYAHAYADDYPDGRFLIGCEGDTDLRESLLKLVPQLGIELSAAEQRDLEAAAVRVKSVLNTRRRTLLVLDNVDDARLLAPQKCARYLPDRAKVHVLATSRLSSDNLPGTECLSLDALAEADAIRLLEKHRPFSHNNRDDEWKAALRIVRRLDGHCLAVEVVAVFLWQNPDVSYQDYLVRLEEEGLAAIEGAGSDELVQLSRHTEKLIGSLLEPTLAALSAEERSVIETASLLPPDNITMPWLQQLTSREFPEIGRDPRPGHPNPWCRVTRRLFGLRLLTPSESGRICRMHRLVQDVVARRMGERRAKRKRHVQLYVRERAKLLWNEWVAQEARWELASLVSYASLILSTGDLFGAWLGSQLTEPLRQLGRFVEARGLLRQTVAIREKKYGADRPQLATSYSNLAMMELALGGLDTARNLLQRAIVIWEKMHAPDNPVLAIGYSNLAAVERSLGDYQAARELARRAIVIWESADQPDLRTLATGYSTLAIVEGYLADFAAARELHRKAIALKEQVYAPDHPTLAGSYSDLALVERSLGNLPAARELCERAIAIKERVYEANHPTLANSYAELAAVERDLAHFFSARVLYQRAVTIRESVYEPDHRILATSYAALAAVEQDLAHFATARELLERALAIRERAYHCDHPSLAGNYASLASLEQELAHYAVSREWHERALALRKKTLADDHPALASSYAGLGSLEKELAHFSAARELLVRALSIREHAHHAEHPALAGAYASMASFEQTMANYPAARDLYDRALSIRQKVFSEAHPILASSYASLASLEQELGNLTEALRLSQQALEIRRKVYESDHPVLANSYSGLAAVEWERGNRAEARTLHEQAFAIRQAAFDPDHPLLASSYSALATAELDLGNVSRARELCEQALAIRKNTFASSHPAIASSHARLASVERTCGNLTAARALLLSALGIDENAYGVDHPTVARDCGALVLVEMDLGHLDEARQLMRRAWSIRANKYGLQNRRTKASEIWLTENDPQFRP